MSPRRRASPGTSRSTCCAWARRRSSATGRATRAVALGALTGGETGAGSITSGSLSLAALTTLNERRNRRDAQRQLPFNQTTTAILSGVGTGFAQAVILNFTFTASATTVDPTGGTLRRRRSGAAHGPGQRAHPFTADDYPGTGGR